MDRNDLAGALMDFADWNDQGIHAEQRAFRAALLAELRGIRGAIDRSAEECPQVGPGDAEAELLTAHYLETYGPVAGE